MRISPKFALLFGVFSILLFSASAITYPKLSDFVTDNANIIDPAYEQQILELAKAIEQNTTAEIAVVTVTSLEGLPIETYAVELFKQAGIGKKDLNNGLLILIAPNEREYRIEVGYGLEGTIPDIRAREIGTNIFVPNFRNNEYGKGIYDAVAVIGGYLQNNEEVISKYRASYVDSSQGKSPLYTFIIYLLFLFMVIGFFRFIFGNIAVALGMKKPRKSMGFFPFFIGYGGGI